MGVHQHLLAVPVPAQGHINPMMRLCRTLAKQGVQVTFVDADPIHFRIQEMMPQQQEEDVSHVDGSQLHPHDHQPLPHETIVLSAHSAPADTGLQQQQQNDALPPSSPEPEVKRVRVPIEGLDLSNGFTMPLKGFAEALNTMAPHLRSLLLHLNHSGPPVTGIISDVCMTYPTQSLADAFQIPRIVFYPSSYGLQLFYYHIRTHPSATVDRVLQFVGKHPPSSADSAIFAEGLEGLPSVLRAADLPHYHHAYDDNQFAYTFFTDVLLESLDKSHSIVTNSFDELEGPARTCLASHFSLPMYTVGPLVEPLSHDSATNLWKEDEACLPWLDKQPPLSVLYISFGSVTSLSQAQFDEIVNGILSSQQRFLWVVRPNIVQGASKDDYHLLDQLLCEKRGCIVEWAPQLKVLAHPSVGGFLTHCGWNSTIEAIYCGVPMLCWPYFADQPLDAKYIVEEWKIGLRVNNTTHGHSLVDKGEIERGIRALMEGDNVKILRENATKLKEASQQVLSTEGTSYKNIQALLKSLYKQKS